MTIQKELDTLAYRLIKSRATTNKYKKLIEEQDKLLVEWRTVATRILEENIRLRNELHGIDIDLD